MRLAITHQTEYHYDQPPPWALQELRLTPHSDAVQQVLAWQLAIDGGRIQAEFDDQHGNRVSLASFEAGMTTIRIRVMGTVETTDRAGVLGAHKGMAPLWYFTRSTPLTKPGAEVRKLVRSLSGDFDGEIRLRADL